MSTKFDSQPTKVATNDTQLPFGLTIDNGAIRESMKRLELEREVCKGSDRTVQNLVDEIADLIGGR